MVLLSLEVEQTEGKKGYNISNDKYDDKYNTNWRNDLIKVITTGRVINNKLGSYWATLQKGST